MIEFLGFKLREPLHGNTAQTPSQTFKVFGYLLAVQIIHNFATRYRQLKIRYIQGIQKFLAVAYNKSLHVNLYNIFATRLVAHAVDSFYKGLLTKEKTDLNLISRFLNYHYTNITVINAIVFAITYKIFPSQEYFHETLSSENKFPEIRLRNFLLFFSKRYY